MKKRNFIQRLFCEDLDEEFEEFESEVDKQYLRKRQIVVNTSETIKGNTKEKETLVTLPYELELVVENIANNYANAERKRLRNKDITIKNQNAEKFEDMLDDIGDVLQEFYRLKFEVDFKDKKSKTKEEKENGRNERSDD